MIVYVFGYVLWKLYPKTTFRYYKMSSSNTSVTVLPPSLPLSLLLTQEVNPDFIVTPSMVVSDEVMEESLHTPMVTYFSTPGNEFEFHYCKRAYGTIFLHLYRALVSFEDDGYFDLNELSLYQRYAIVSKSESFHYPIHQRMLNVLLRLVVAIKQANPTFTMWIRCTTAYLSSVMRTFNHLYSGTQGLSMLLQASSYLNDPDNIQRRLTLQFTEQFVYIMKNMPEPRVDFTWDLVTTRHFASRIVQLVFPGTFVYPPFGKFTPTPRMLQLQVMLRVFKYFKGRYGRNSKLLIDPTIPIDWTLYEFHVGLAFETAYETLSNEYLSNSLISLRNALPDALPTLHKNDTPLPDVSLPTKRVRFMP